MRALRIRAVAVLGLLAIGVRGSAAENDARAECTFNPRAFPSPATVFRDLSERAELVAPSTTSSRHRAVVPPPPPLTFTAKNFIDDEIFGKMVRDKVRWTSPSTDEEFIRRITLDLTGAIPDAATVRAFLTDTSPGKREAMIDKLLASDGFTDRWTMWIGDHVRNVQRAMNTKIQFGARNRYYHYLHDAIASGKAYDQIVRDVVAGTGNSASNGAVVFWPRQIQSNGPIQDTYDDLSAFSGERFLGMPFVCLSCHDGLGHLEQVNSAMAHRTRADFWRNAAFFARSGPTATPVDPDSDTVSYTIADFPQGEYKLNTVSGNKTPRTPLNGKATADPAFFLTGETPKATEGRRQAYARMLTADPQFARATVNFVWKEIFGAGIVEPADSFDLARQNPASLAAGATLQPTHPQLLTKLAQAFIAGNYDLRGLIRTIVVSNAYQLSSRYTAGAWNEAWAPYYARHYPRRLMAEEIFDAIVSATGVGATLGVSGGGSVPRAMLLPDPTEGGTFADLLDHFERGNRDDDPRSSDGSVLQALALLDDPFVSNRIVATNPASLVARLLGQSNDPAAIAEGLYLNTLSRYPTADEKTKAVAYLKSGELAKKTEDLQFALINKLEFLFN
ncbi:MAG TPA: DUF1549 domain-containing protein [Thermoanaerobaculia bacterium]|nr:DUF1549 domain-containing protein [Thermoanaerobaculia bacterium]